MVWPDHIDDTMDGTLAMPEDMRMHALSGSHNSRERTSNCGGNEDSEDDDEDDEDDGEVDHEEFSGSEDGGSPQRGARDLEQYSKGREAPLADVGEQSNQNSRSTSSISMGSRTRGQGGGSPGRGVVF